MSDSLDRTLPSDPPVRPPTGDMLVGRVFDGRYELHASIGHGGMGTVYRAHDLSGDREVAIKVIHPKHGSDRLVAKRFLREARLARRLSQPNIVQVHDSGEADDGILYLVMELLRGHTLARELEHQHALPLERGVKIGLQLCDALEAADDQGIVHRDLKPGNIFILEDPPARDVVKVLDFGLAKSLQSDPSLRTSADTLLGTPLYMPPEQILGHPIDPRADLYALGCILHHMLTGTPPFVRDSIERVLAAHVREAPPPLPAAFPGELAAIVAKLLAKEPAERPAHAGEVRAVLQSVIGTSADRGAVPRARPGRRWWLLAVALAVASAGAALVLHQQL